MMRAYLEFVVKGHLEYVVRDQQVDNKRDCKNQNKKIHRKSIQQEKNNNQ